MAIFHGVGINFGVGSTVIGVNGAFQTRDHSIIAESELIKDGGETTVSKVYWDMQEHATFTYVAFQPGYWPFGNATVSMPDIASFVTVYDTTYAQIVGSWLVDEITVTSSNTTATKVTLHLSRYPFLIRQ